MDSVIPWKTLSATYSVDVSTPEWNLAELPEDGSDAPRFFSVPVFFEADFYNPPVVQLSITGFDIDQRDSVRVRLTAENITTSGFTVNISTWADTRVYGVDFSWFAIGS